MIEAFCSSLITTTSNGGLSCPSCASVDIRRGKNFFVGKSLRRFVNAKQTLSMSYASQYEVRVEEKGRCRVLEAQPEENLRLLLKRNNVDLYTLGGKLKNCGGNGACGLCKVDVIDGFGNLSATSASEDTRLKDKPMTYRLACRAKVLGPVTVRTKPE